MASPAGLGFWPVTDVGKVRAHNEDSFLVDKKLSLFVVCDGMGGHAAGEVASQIASRAMRDALVKGRATIEQFEQGDPAVTRKQMVTLMESSVLHACAEVHAEGQRDATKRGMGTTLVALLIVGNRGFIAHVGDSRVYVIRQGAAHQLTEDHSLINELVRRGRGTPKELEGHEFKNAMTRAVGVYESVEVDVLDFDVLPGDRYLLCSDGLHGYLADGELAKVFAETPEEKVGEALITLANSRGGKDNITVIVVSVPSTTGADRLASELHMKMDVLARMPLFRFLTYQELVRVLNITQVKTCSAGAQIVRQGDEGNEMYIVLTGEMRVHTQEALITKLGPGQFFGEMALIDKAPRSAHVTADDPSRFLVIHRRDFFDLLRRDHTVAVKLLWSFVGVLTERLRTTSKDLGDAREQLHRTGITKEFLLLNDDD